MIGDWRRIFNPKISYKGNFFFAILDWLVFYVQNRELNSSSGMFGQNLMKLALKIFNPVLVHFNKNFNEFKHSSYWLPNILVVLYVFFKSLHHLQILLLDKHSPLPTCLLKCVVSAPEELEIGPAFNTATKLESHSESYAESI